jgi:hypothetical protein
MRLCFGVSRSGSPAKSTALRPRAPLAARLFASALASAFASALASCVQAHSTSTPSPRNVGPDTARYAPEPPAHAQVPTGTAPARPAKELPRGGRTLFPAYRLVGFCGTPGAPALGALQGNLPAIAKTLEAQAADYAHDRDLLPVFELIAVVVQAWPGPDGKYRHRVDESVVREYLRVARQSRALLLLNIQPGQSDFVTEVKYFEEYLREPDIGVALDPEWAMKAKQKPGVYYGQTTGETLNEVAAYLSDLIAQNDLPEKPLVFHQVNRDVLKDESQVKHFPGVVMIKSVDGLGPAYAKVATYGNLMETIGADVHPGFKLFFDEDRRNGRRLMTPKQVLALSPRPEYVMYE